MIRDKVVDTLAGIARHRQTNRIPVQAVIEALSYEDADRVMGVLEALDSEGAITLTDDDDGNAVAQLTTED